MRVAEDCVFVAGAVSSFESALPHPANSHLLTILGQQIPTTKNSSGLKNLLASSALPSSISYANVGCAIQHVQLHWLEHCRWPAELFHKTSSGPSNTFAQLSLLTSFEL